MANPESAVVDGADPGAVVVGVVTGAALEFVGVGGISEVGFAGGIAVVDVSGRGTLLLVVEWHPVARATRANAARTAINAFMLLPLLLPES
jgi:hypothetical protein